MYTLVYAFFFFLNSLDVGRNKNIRVCHQQYAPDKHIKGSKEHY